MKVEEAFKLKINQWQTARLLETTKLGAIDDDINTANSAGSANLMMGELRRVTTNEVRLEEDMKIMKEDIKIIKQQNQEDMQIIKQQNQRLLEILNDKFETRESDT